MKQLKLIVIILVATCLIFEGCLLMKKDQMIDTTAARPHISVNEQISLSIEQVDHLSKIAKQSSKSNPIKISILKFTEDELCYETRFLKSGQGVTTFPSCVKRNGTVTDYLYGVSGKP